MNSTRAVDGTELREIFSGEGYLDRGERVLRVSLDFSLYSYKDHEHWLECQTVRFSTSSAPSWLCDLGQIT